MSETKSVDKARRKVDDDGMEQNAYSIRAEVLRRIGFDCYADYLRSGLWARVREQAFAANGRSCIRCGRIATSIHHAGYDEPTLTGDDVAGLLPVCGRCHKLAERRSDGSKTTIEQATAFLRIPWRAPRGPKPGTRLSSKAQAVVNERKRLWAIAKKMEQFRRMVNPQGRKAYRQASFMRITQSMADCTARLAKLPQTP